MDAFKEGHELKAAREERRIGQAAAAARISTALGRSISQNLYAGWERGTVPCPDDLRVAMLDEVS